MPRNLLSLFLRLSRDDGEGRRRRSISLNRSHGAGGRRRAYLRMRNLRRFGHGWNGRHHNVGGFRGPHSHHGGPAMTPPIEAFVPYAHHPVKSLPVQTVVTAVQPLETAVSPSSPTPGVVEVDGDALANFSALGSGLRSFTNAAVVDAVAPSRPPSPTPAVVRATGTPLMQVRGGDVLTFVSAPTGASVFAFGSGVAGSSNHTVVGVDAVAPHLPSPRPTTSPSSPRADARRRLLALGLPLSSPPADSLISSRDHRTGTWNPAALLANGAILHGGSEDEDERSGCFARRR